MYLMKRVLRFMLTALLAVYTGNLTAQTDLRVSDNGRFLQHRDGSPFFYLGDTAWELIHRLDREEVVAYLQDRSEKGFTVIQTVILAEHNGLTEPNAYGAIPLTDNDPSSPVEAYFEHVDFVLDKAAELNIYVALLPTWGDKLFKDKWGAGPEIFDTANARAYGEFLGRRYFERRNIIWVIGGDRNPRDNSTDVQVWRALARGIVDASGGNENVMMTFHPQTASSRWFHDDDWLDFNMLQTSHCANTKVWEKIDADYQRSPIKPVMDGEPMYEEIPVCFDLANGYADPNDIRRKAYLSLFAGAHGHTYGCNNIWQMYVPERKGVLHPTKPWHESLDLPGAQAMKFVRALMESRPMFDRVPDQSMIVDNTDNYKERIQATRGLSYAFIYSSYGLPFQLVMGRITGRRVLATWYNPRTGEKQREGFVKNKGIKQFTPPSSGNDSDWVLILDDVQKL